MNLLRPGTCAGYVNTGAWAKGAIADARHYGEIYIAWDGAADGYTRTPEDAEIEVRDGTRYVHITSNETIGGIRFPDFPAVDVPLVADMSSELMARDPLGPVRSRLRRRTEESRPGRHGAGLHTQVGGHPRQRVHRPLPALRHPPRQGVAVQHPSDRARSPLHHASRLGCPIIFFQGLDDRVVPPNQAELMVDALDRQGLPVACLMFEGEGHGFRQAGTIRRCLEAELLFYARVFGFEPADALAPVDIRNLSGS